MIQWKKIFSLIEKLVEKNQLPSVTEIAKNNKDPYRVLISTILSLRTKDEVTLEASIRLFKKADSPNKMLKLSEEVISKLIFPVGFYKNKSKNILEITKILLEKYNGLVPSSQEELLSLPGVGLKTANLTLSEGFNLDYICVDIHVHRISNRLGWIKTNTPDESETELSKILPKEHWKPINQLFVSFGKEICRPISPFCSKCNISKYCKKLGVDKSR